MVTTKNFKTTLKVGKLRLKFTSTTYYVLGPLLKRFPSAGSRLLVVRSPEPGETWVDTGRGHCQKPSRIHRFSHFGRACGRSVKGT